MTADALKEHADNAHTVQSYDWKHDAREFHVEHARVREVLQARAHLKGGLLNMSISFDEAFVFSDEERVLLLQRLRDAYTTHCTTQNLDAMPAILGRLRKPLSSLSSAADCSWMEGIDKICRMQVVTEELKPETRDLIKRCTSQEQLEASMLAVKPTEQVSHPLYLKVAHGRTRVSVRKVSPRHTVRRHT
jgi:hypothetical protein